MKRGAFAAAAALSLGGSVGWAQPVPAPPAPSAGFAVIVTNNRSVERTRPDLQYADDDGVEYARLFGRLLGAEHVRLLTELDVSSRRLYGSEPAAQGRPPTGTELDAAVGWAAERVGAARRAGARTAFYFVFAGHGDVERGQGFVELSDGRLDARGLEARVLSRVGADATHVILDSCNSFFVISPRRLGGRRWATARDAAMGLSGRLPNVGVFLSTSAEAEVFEWSELQSGIFSHLVRSGLAGGADADGDGLIRYDELSAFVVTATATVANDLYRPRLFSRGPGGRGSDVIVDLQHAPGPRLRVAAPGRRRLTLRDAEGVRVLDVHKDDGVALSLVVAPELTVEEQRTGAGERPERLAHNLAAAEGGSLVLVPSVPAAAPRGPEGIFRQLFAEPFGPAKVAAYQAQQQRSAPAPVYGIANQDVQRMRLHLRTLAEMAHETRTMGAGAAVAQGLVLGVLGGFALADWPQSPFGRGAALAVVIMAPLEIVLGLILPFVTLPAEDLYLSFQRRLAAGADAASLFVETDATLAEQVQKARANNNVLRATGWILVGLAGVLAAVWEGALWTRSLGPVDAYDPLAWAGRVLYSAAGISGGAIAWAGSHYRSEIEVMYDRWHQDPGLGLRLGVAPAPGGAVVSLGGSFDVLGGGR